MYLYILVYTMCTTEGPLIARKFVQTNAIPNNTIWVYKGSIRPKQCALAQNRTDFIKKSVKKSPCYSETTLFECGLFKDPLIHGIQDMYIICSLHPNPTITHFVVICKHDCSHVIICMCLDGIHIYVSSFVDKVGWDHLWLYV